MTTIDGITVKAVQCEHCNRLPSEDDVKSALKASKDGWRPPCAVCDGKFKLLGVELFHYKECGQDRWASRVTAYERIVELYNHKGGTVFLHVSCASKVMPRKNWGEAES